jgi:hypothetical protein
MMRPERFATDFSSSGLVGGCLDIDGPAGLQEDGQGLHVGHKLGVGCHLGLDDLLHGAGQVGGLLIAGAVTPESKVGEAGPDHLFGRLFGVLDKPMSTSGSSVSKGWVRSSTVSIPMRRALMFVPSRKRSA